MDETVTGLENFDPDWLALREPLDHATRSRRLEELLAARLADRERVRVVDLGAGSGSTLRHLAPRLRELGVAAEQDWVLVDHDEDLLARALATPVAAAASVGTARVDLADRDALRSVLSGADVVVGSALLDVLPAPVATGLVEVLSTLDPTGRALRPDGRRGSDERTRRPGVAEGFDADQRSHGLGPDATGVVADALAAHGWSVERDETPWRLGPSPLLDAWAEGWFAAAGVPVQPLSAAVVPHEDLLAQ